MMMFVSLLILSKVQDIQYSIKSVLLTDLQSEFLIWLSLGVIGA